MVDAVGTEGTPEPVEGAHSTTDEGVDATVDAASTPESAEVASFRERFLEATYTTQEQREKAGIDWALMKAIADDHEANKSLLNDTAETFARTIQKMDKVHSVRYRVKDTWHLIDKIIRKKSEENVKYIDISLENYASVITDLVGLRVLHLFKYEMLDLRKQLDDILVVLEGPVAYIREGDGSVDALADAYKMEVKVHPSNYRSVHYIAESQVFKRRVKLEVQVRTIYEEAWSEIDHRVNYPQKCDPVIGYLLSILNRLSGSADEMGDYVQTLKAYIQTKNLELEQAIQKSKDDFFRAEELTEQIQDAYKKGDDAQKEIAALKAQMIKARISSENVSAAKVAASSAISGNLDMLTVAGSRDSARLKEMMSMPINIGALARALASNPLEDEFKKHHAQLEQMLKMGMSTPDLQNLTKMVGPGSDVGKLNEAAKISDTVKKSLGGL